MSISVDFDGGGVIGEVDGIVNNDVGFAILFEILIIRLRFRPHW